MSRIAHPPLLPFALPGLAPAGNGHRPRRPDRTKPRGDAGRPRLRSWIRGARSRMVEEGRSIATLGPRTTILALALLALILAMVLASAPPAFAAQTVQLRADAMVRNGVVTLADVFEGAGSAGPVVVASGTAPGGSVVLDAGRLQALALQNGLVWNNSRGLRRVIARPGATASAAAPARTAKVLAYGRDIGSGEVVQGEDLVWSQTLAFAPGDAPRDSGMIVGMAAKRPLRAGSAVSLRDVAAPQVIKKDELISVTYAAGGVRLVLQGKAMAGAAAGEPFGVLNPTSKKVLQALAIGPGEAIVGPEADRLRAALRTDPKLFASLR